MTIRGNEGNEKQLQRRGERGYRKKRTREGESKGGKVATALGDWPSWAKGTLPNGVDVIGIIIIIASPDRTIESLDAKFVAHPLLPECGRPGLKAESMHKVNDLSYYQSCIQ